MRIARVLVQIPPSLRFSGTWKTENIFLFPDDFRLTAQEEELKAKEALRKVKFEEEKKQKTAKKAGKKKAFFF